MSKKAKKHPFKDIVNKASANASKIESDANKAIAVATTVGNITGVPALKNASNTATIGLFTVLTPFENTMKASLKKKGVNITTEKIPQISGLYVKHIIENEPVAKTSLENTHTQNLEHLFGWSFPNIMHPWGKQFIDKKTKGITYINPATGEGKYISPANGKVAVVSPVKPNLENFESFSVKPLTPASIVRLNLENESLNKGDISAIIKAYNSASGVHNLDDDDDSDDDSDDDNDDGYNNDSDNQNTYSNPSQYGSQNNQSQNQNQSSDSDAVIIQNDGDGGGGGDYGGGGAASSSYTSPAQIAVAPIAAQTAVAAATPTTPFTANITNALAASGGVTPAAETLPTGIKNNIANLFHGLVSGTGSTTTAPVTPVKNLGEIPVTINPFAPHTPTLTPSQIPASTTASVSSERTTSIPANRLTKSPMQYRKTHSAPTSFRSTKRHFEFLRSLEASNETDIDESVATQLASGSIPPVADTTNLINQVLNYLKGMVNKIEGKPLTKDEVAAIGTNKVDVNEAKMAAKIPHDETGFVLPVSTTTKVNWWQKILNSLHHKK